MSEEKAKREAAREAARLLPDTGVIGLGTGSTAHYFIEAVAEAVRAGKQFRGVATSDASRALAESQGIELLSDDGPWSIDLCVDGADEVSPDLNLIKGGGGSHTREKIVNFASAKNVIVVDESKLSARLGERRAVPVEILNFAHGTTVRALGALGPATLRRKGEALYITDAGNLICDVRVGPMDDPASIERQLRGIPGVIETGIFCRRADTVIVAGEQGIRHLVRGG